MKTLTMLSMSIALLSAMPVLLAQEAPAAATQPDGQKAREQAIERAKAWLHEKRGVPCAKMTLQSAVASTWPDAALGCPEKGRMYAQVVTTGWTVILEAEGKTHEVHVSGRRTAGCAAKDASRPAKDGLR